MLALDFLVTQEQEEEDEQQKSRILGVRIQIDIYDNNNISIWPGYITKPTADINAIDSNININADINIINICNNIKCTNLNLVTRMISISTLPSYHHDQYH